MNLPERYDGGQETLARWVVYVAGPYSAPDSWAREQNIRRAEEVSLAVIESGLAPLCIHTMSRYWFGHVSEEYAIRTGLELLRRSDAVVLVEGWERSSGSLAEIAEAIKLNIPVHPNIPDLLAARVLSPARLVEAQGSNIHFDPLARPR